MQNRFLRLIPGAPAVQAQLATYRDLLRDLRPLYPILVPYLIWVFIRSYNQEQERMRLGRLAPILRPEKRLPEDKPAQDK
jgi:hypothetical protein